MPTEADAPEQVELTERLRAVASNLTPGAIDNADLDGMAFTVTQAADALTRTPSEAVAEVERLRAALKPFVSALLDYGDTPDDRREYRDNEDVWEHPIALNITFGDLRRARTALNGDQTNERA